MNGVYWSLSCPKKLVRSVSQKDYLRRHLFFFGTYTKNYLDSNPFTARRALTSIPRRLGPERVLVCLIGVVINHCCKEDAKNPSKGKRKADVLSLELLWEPARLFFLKKLLRDMSLSKHLKVRCRQTIVSWVLLCINPWMKFGVWAGGDSTTSHYKGCLCFTGTFLPYHFFPIFSNVKFTGPRGKGGSTCGLGPMIIDSCFLIWILVILFHVFLRRRERQRQRQRISY